MILTVTVIDSTGITISGDQTEISVVNPATSVTYNPTTPFTATNVQDALPQAHKMIGEQTNDYSVTLQSPNKFEIQSGSEYARLQVSGGAGSFGADLVSSDIIRLITNGTNLSAVIDSGSSTFYDKLLVEGNPSQSVGLIQTNNTSGSQQHHVVMKNSGANVGFLGSDGDSALLGIGSISVAVTSAGFFGGDLSPATQYGGTKNASIDLGKTNSRFRDLYLSDNLYADGVSFEDANISFTSDQFILNNASNNNLITTTSQGVNLKYNGVQRLATTNSGVSISGGLDATTGNIANLNTSGTLSAGNVVVSGSMSVGGTVGGRDISVDGDKLDNIESGATADQTDAEIRAAVDAATDSNVYTDTEKAKLTGIETGATADQTDAEIRSAVASATDSNVFTDSEKTKLSGAAELDSSPTFTGTVSSTGLAVDTDTLYVDEANDRVGINTSSPDYNLVVADTGTSTVQIKAGNANYSQLNFGDTDDNDIGQIAYIHDSNEMRFTSNNSQAMVIDSSGNVGIGATSPTRKLTVQGGSGDNLPARIVGGSGTTKSHIEFQDASTTADYKVTLGSIGDGMSFQAGGFERMRIHASGKVGIGTTDPSSELDVIGKAKITYPQADILYIKRDHVSDANTVITFDQPTKNTYIGADPSNHFVIGNTLNLQTQNIARFRDNYDVSFYEDTGTTPRFSWDASAESLGIGTSTPNARLHVASNAGQSDIAKFGSALQSTYSKVDFDTDNSAGDKYIIAYGSLHSTQANDFAMKNQTANGDISFATQTGTQMTIKSNGKVGIGTQSPSQDLHISGGTTSGEVTKVTIGGTGGNAVSHLQLAEYFNASNEMVYGFSLVNAGADNNNLYIKHHDDSVSGSVAMSVGRSNGYVGIGVNEPQVKLQVQSGGEAIRVNTTDENTHMSFGGVRGLFGYSADSQSAVVQGIGGKSIIFCTNNNTFGSGEKVRITTGGKLGIGTDAPLTMLHVANDSTQGNMATFGSALQTSYTKVNFDTDSATGENYIIAYGASHASEAGNFAIKNVNPNGELIFTANSIEGLRIDNLGVVNVPNGINFGGSVNSGGTVSSSNNLDDYEEGTWTPTGSTNVDNLTGASGSYTKIGRQVTVTFSFTVDLAQNQAFNVSGLPFAVADKLANTAIEATGVTFSDNHYKLLYASHSSTQLVFSGDIAGSQEEPAFYRGSITYFTT